MTNSHPWFGTRLEGWVYQPRPSAYLLQFDAAGRVLVVRTRGRTSLPGGRIEDGETAWEAAQREALEETGFVVPELIPLCAAGQWSVNRRGDRAYEKHCSFFLSLGPAAPDRPAEPDHESDWLIVEAALDELHYESHCWALVTAVDRRSSG